MRRITVGLVLFFIGIGVCFTPSSTYADAQPSWVQGSPTVARNVATVDTQNSCQTHVETAYIKELAGTRDVCMFGNDKFKVGTINDNGVTRAVFSYALSAEMHTLIGICSAQCWYTPDTDQLITLQQIGPYGRGLVIYGHASKRIYPLEQSGVTSYLFDKTSPEYEIKNDAGRYVATPTFAVSDNGSYVVVELADKGTAVIDTKTLTSRQILTDGYHYGYGFDPNEQLAIGNNGKTVAVGGLNAAFTVVDITNTCGQPLIGDLVKLSGYTDCARTDLGITSLFQNFRIAEQPKFYGDGYELEVRIGSWVQAPRTVTFLANGVTPAHRLKLLSLGDSFTSGEGETDASMYAPEAVPSASPCHVSRRAYPSEFARGLGISPSDIRSVACAGAQIGDIIGSQDSYWGQGNRLKNGTPPTESNQTAKHDLQTAALDSFQSGVTLQGLFIKRYNPEMITIGIGGNDAGLMGKLRSCVAPGTCEWAQDDKVQRTYAEIARLYGKLGALFAYVRKQAPDAKVLVVGYPDIIDPDGKCSAVTGALLNRAERQYMRGGIHYLNETIRAAAEKSGFLYADIEQSYGGQKLCGGTLPAAMNGIRYGDDITVVDTIPLTKVVGSETFHPTPTGHILAAQTMLAQYPQFATSAVNPENHAISPPAYPGSENEHNTTQSFQTHFAVQQQTDTRVMNITLPSGSLLPGSSIDVEIHSDETALRTLVVDQNGGATTIVSVPTSVADGYHTLHIFGTNTFGAAVDLYQFVTIGEVGADMPVTKVDAAPLTVDTHPVLLHAAKTEGTVSTDASAPYSVPLPYGLGSVLGSAALVAQKSHITPAMHVAVIPKTHDVSNTILQFVVGGIGAAIVGTIIMVLLYRRWAKPGS